MNKDWPKPDVEPLSDVAWRRVEAGVFAQLDRDLAATASSRLGSSRTPWILGGAGLAVAAAAAVALFVGGAHDATPASAHVSRVVTHSAKADVTVADAAVSVAPESSITSTSGPTGATIVLDQGTVSCRVPKQKKGNRFVVDAGNVRVTVIGTEFSVTREGDGALVAVTEGTVRVAYNGRYALVDAGEEWSSTDEEYEFSAADARKRRRARKRRKRRSSSAMADKAPDLASEVEEEVVEKPNAQTLYRKAAQVEASQPNDAALLYRQASAQGGVWGALALYAHGRMELDRGNKGRGRALLERYLRRHPSGANVDDARELLGR